MSQTDQLLAKALSYHQKGDIETAEKIYQDILTAEPRHADALHLSGMIADQVGDTDKAIQLIHDAILSNPEAPVYLNNLGTIYENQGNLAEAEYYYEKALVTNSSYADAATNLSNIYLKQDDIQKAIILLENTVMQHPEHIQALFNLAKLYQLTHQVDKALQTYLSLLNHAPNFLPGYVNLGTLLHAQHRLEDAYNCFNYVITANPDYLEGQYNLALTLLSMNKLKEALSHLKAAEAINPNHIKTLLKLGDVSIQLNHFKTAESYFKSAYELASDDSLVVASYYYSRLLNANWDQLDTVHEQLSSCLEKDLNANKSIGLTPDLAKYLNLSQAVINQISDNYANQLSIGNALFSHTKSEKDKLRLGYVFASIHSEELQLLMNALLTHHDRDAFDIYCYQLQDETDYDLLDNKNLSIKNLASLTYLDAAKEIYNDKIDILIDLSGFQKNAWPQIFAARPAPIQCSYEIQGSYNSSTDIDCVFSAIDTIAANNCFNLDAPFSVADFNKASTKKEDYHLPQDTIVLCNFNPIAYMDYEVFSVWLNILQSVDNSVLWLTKCQEAQKNNLQQVAAQHGIKSDRLLYCNDDAPLTTGAVQHADVYLDSYVTSGGAHVAAALWHGIPVVTKKGTTIHSQAGATLVECIGHEELITKSTEEYIKKCIQLANNPRERQKITNKRLSHKSVLFNPKAFTTAIEKHYKTLWKNYLN